MSAITAGVEQMEMRITAAVGGVRRGPGNLPVRGRPLGRVRADALPEFTRYRDDGCDVHPTCLSCPLPRCRYEEPGGLRALLNEYRDRQIIRLRRKGVPVEELAGRFGISRRTVFRVLEVAAQRGTSLNARRPKTAPPAYLRRSQEAAKEARCA